MRYLYILILLSSGILLYAENQLDIVWQMQGEISSDEFGKMVIALDFNGDGIDDLAVNARKYYNDPDHVLHRGKLYIYFGSDTGLPETPDLSISAPADTAFHHIIASEYISNLGDMNNDGCDDIGYNYIEVTFDGLYHTYRQMRILLGNTVNDTIPDYEYEISDTYAEIHPLGDINGDGYDDAGITEGNYSLTYSIVYGGSFEKVRFVEGRYTRGSKGFWGLGDVNGDGFDDFMYNYEDPYDEHSTFHNCFFYGAATQDTVADYHMVNESTAGYNLMLVPAGDWNGDGYDDFAFYSYFEAGENGNPSPGCRLWRGGETIHWDWFGYIEYYGRFFPSHGDINGDGKGDLINSYIISTGNAGYLYFYIGDQNGTWDYNGYTPEEGYGGYYTHAVGDFDNDGCDDIAVGAYGDEGSSSPNNFGHVFVYGGHEDLVEQDTNDADDETVPLADITFNAYPNPFNPEVSFEVKTDAEYHDLTIEIYNIRGQKVETIAVDHAGEAVTWKPKDKASGIYTCKLTAEGKQLSTRKVTLLK